MAALSKIFFGGRLGASWVLTGYADLSYTFERVFDHLPARVARPRTQMSGQARPSGGHGEPLDEFLRL